MKFEIDLTEEEIKQVINALQKDEPKEPLAREACFYPKCPVCGCLIIGGKQKYCHSCGQHLIWKK